MVNTSRLAVMLITGGVLSSISFGMYNPQTGRFMQRDPHGINPAGGAINPFAVHKQYADEMNLYQYVKSGPIEGLDPLGFETMSECEQMRNERRAKSYGNYRDCMINYCGMDLGQNAVACAMSCVLSYIGSPISYKICVSICGGCQTLISLACAGQCQQQLKNTLESAEEAYERCMGKAEDRIEIGER